MEESNQKIIILTAPSGAGKTTIKTQLLTALPKTLSFSVSATTRKIRGNEQEGIDYFYISEDDFKNKVAQHAFIEWEMVYPGLYYGTTMDEVQRIWRENKIPLLDIDVKGALNIKKHFGKNALTMFIEPPSIEILKQRLTNRGTDTSENIAMRIEKATFELQYRDQFDAVIVNDDLKKATDQTITNVMNFIGKG
jgi:guanylate kinase